MAIIHFFSLLYNNPLNKYNLFVHPTMDGHMGGFWFGAVKDSFAVYDRL